MLSQEQQKMYDLMFQITEWAQARSIDLSLKNDQAGSMALRKEFDDWISYTDDEDVERMEILSMTDNNV